MVGTLPCHCFDLLGDGGLCLLPWPLPQPAHLCVMCQGSPKAFPGGTGSLMLLLKTVVSGHWCQREGTAPPPTSISHLPPPSRLLLEELHGWVWSTPPCSLPPSPFFLPSPSPIPHSPPFCLLSHPLPLPILLLLLQSPSLLFPLVFSLPVAQSFSSAWLFFPYRTCFNSNSPCPRFTFYLELHNANLLGNKIVLSEGNGTPLQYSCLENPMDGGAW